MNAPAIITANQLLRMPEVDCRYELVAGQLRSRAFVGWREGMVGGELLGLLGEHVRQRGLGMLLGAGTGFVLARDPDTVLAPSFAFLSAERLRDAPIDDSFWPGAPDLVVEVASPSDTIREIDDKAKAWLAAGTRLVWVVNPAWRNVTVYRAANDIRTLAENDDLTGEDVVPGPLAAWPNCSRTYDSTTACPWFAALEARATRP